MKTQPWRELESEGRKNLKKSDTKRPVQNAHLHFPPLIQALKYRNRNERFHIPPGAGSCIWNNKLGSASVLFGLEHDAKIQCFTIGTFFLFFVNAA